MFEVGSDKLQDPALESLGKIAAGITSSYPGAAVEVRGHTDSTGTAAANQSLSERRAVAVANFLGAKGIDKATLSSVGLGQTARGVVELRVGVVVEHGFGVEERLVSRDAHRGH